MERSTSEETTDLAPDGTPSGFRVRAARLTQALRRTDANPTLVRAMRATRDALPGQVPVGDDDPASDARLARLLARHLVEVGERGDSATREVGLTALQLWQALSRATGRGAGTHGVAILFTDLVGFSTWALEVGDDAALELLREVAGVVEPEIRDRDGRVVKRLGDGHMAVFGSAQAALDAALEVQRRLVDVEVEGYRPSLRIGIHVGHPRRMRGDYLGADVNIAARLTEAADGGQVLVSHATLGAVERDGLQVKRRRRFRAKGTPRELEVFAVRRS